MIKNPMLAPSLLSADFANLDGAIKKIEYSSASLVHVDVMDGEFVSEISFGQPVIKSLRPLTQLPFDVHLMVNHPENQIESMAKSGADIITFHYEAANDIGQLIKKIHSLGKKAGVSIKPETSVEVLSEIIFDVDIILVMTVNPGFGGQKLIPECLKKVTELKSLREKLGLNYSIEVDGGVNGKTLKSVLDAGTDIVVSGSAFFNDTLNWGVK